ncbi:MAG: hypothetical protein RLZZ350_800 [Verrucomicrobiota bacterium]|jgi:D-alanyl-lipoteichoic acid acyltransferase DltB (MBOAT superfamily)
MLFNSYVFIFAFLPLVFFGFLALGRAGKRRAAISWVVLLSFGFYGWWNPKYLWLICGSMAFNYFVGVRLSRLAKTPRGKLFLTLGVAANLTLLAYYKYTDFLIGNWNYIFHAALPLQHVILPLGISFFTFTQIAYLVDAYRGETREYNPLDYALFVLFFPHLIAGPIVHHKDIIPQFSLPRTFKFNPEFVAVGFSIFIIGLFKKTVFADGIAKYSSPMFALAGSDAHLGAWTAWGGVLAYTLQIYFDFSGYSDMAIGLAKMFGVKFPVNFDSPYQAVNIVDFWRRWHMTLSRFLRDYLYIPLGGNRLGNARRYLNLFLTMLLGGLWHGAGWTFIIWGALHGIYLAVNHAWSGWRKTMKFDRNFGLPGKICAVAVTFLAVIVAWVFFRAENVHVALKILRGMVALPELASVHLGEIKASARQLLLTVALLAIVWLLPNSQRLMARFEPALDGPTVSDAQVRRWHWQPKPVFALALAAAFLVAVLHLSQVTEFLYFQF